LPPAARLGDMHTCPMVTPGVPPVPHVGGPILPPCAVTVLIGNMPAARVSDMATCVGPPDVIAMGSPTVFICNLMAARIGDPTVHGGVIVIGCPTVIIGEVGMGAPVVVAPDAPGVPPPPDNEFENATASMCSPEKQIATMQAAAKNGVPFCPICSATKAAGGP
jgi:uncharacterized Zn-binding protein involved in type VI secretion